MPDAKLFTPDPTIKYWRIKLIETVADVLITEGWIRQIPARDKQEAGFKGLMFYMRRNPGTRPTLDQIELEPWSRPLRIRG